MRNLVTVLALMLLTACSAQAGAPDTLSPPIGPDAPVSMTSTIGQAINANATAPAQGFRGF